MLIKTNLLFRKCEKFINSDGEETLRIKFEDDNCESYTFFVPLDKEHEHYLSMKKDTPCNVDLVIYKSSKNAKYNIYANF